MQHPPYHRPQQWAPAPAQQSHAGRPLYYLAGALAAIAFCCFAYVGITWLSDQNNGLMLLADSTSLVRFGVFGFIAFFVSYFCLVIGILLEK